MLRSDDTLLLASRLCIAALFIGGAWNKAMSPEMAGSLLQLYDLPDWLLWLALPFNVFAGLALVFGMMVRPVAILLAGYCIMTSLFHFIPGDPWQMSIFVKNWAIAGGCLALAVAGAGRFAAGGGIYLSDLRTSRSESV